MGFWLAVVGQVVEVEVEIASFRSRLSSSAVIKLE